jgi:hypothetical protein
MQLVLQFVPDEDDPWGIVASYRDRLAPGSQLVVSHPTTADRPAGLVAVDQIAHAAGQRATIRSREDIARLFTGLHLAEPGLVWVPQWRPDQPCALDDQPYRSGTLAAVAGVSARRIV